MDLTLIIILVYFAILFGIAWFVSRRESLDSYFLNKRSTSVAMMTFASFSTIVGAGSTVGLIGEVHSTGISYGIALPISYFIGALIFAWLAKRIRSQGEAYNASNLADFFEKRFDRRTAYLAGILQLILMVVWTTTQVIAMGTLFSLLTNISYPLAILLSAFTTILYTSVGGLKIDIITDFVQFWIILVVFIAMAVIGLASGFSVPSVIHALPAGHLDPFAFGGVPFFIGIFLLSGLIYIGGSHHWQRILSTRNASEARRSFLWLAPFILLFALIVLYLGLLSVGIVSVPNQDQTLFVLMQKLLPTWAVGFGFAAVLAIVMSSVDSTLIGGSTIVSHYLFENVKVSARKRVNVARLVTALFGVLAFVFAFVYPDIVSVGLLASYLAGCFGAPIFAALFSEKISASAAFWSLLCSSIVLFVVFPIVGTNTFVFSTLVSVLIVLFYDRVANLFSKTAA